MFLFSGTQTDIFVKTLDNAVQVDIAALELSAHNLHSETKELSKGPSQLASRRQILFSSPALCHYSRFPHFV